MDSGIEGEAVLALARSEARVLLTEDKDFGLLAYAGGHETVGVVLIRFPAGVRRSLGWRSQMPIPGGTNWMAASRGSPPHLGRLRLIRNATRRGNMSGIGS
ncbi:MAG: DUF5615 family PIN-like protein [Chloroflexi bacterium]|nr:DUF5615 family PIN-like protein [Chloroflexota bacterium]